MARVRFNRNFNINRVVKRLVRTILALYVGGTILTTLGGVMVNTSSPFYEGLTLVGWTLSDFANNGTDYCIECSTGCDITIGAGATGTTTCISATSGSGVLAVVGIIAIAQIITEFITW